MRQDYLDEERIRIGRIKKLVIGGLAALIGIITIKTAVYSVNPDSQGVVRRWGRYIRTTEPGLHGNLPFNIEKVDIMPVKSIQREEFGFRTIKAGVESVYLDAENVEGVDSPYLESFLKEKGMEIRADIDRRSLLPRAREALQNEYLMLTGDLNMADVEWIVQYKIKDPVAYLFNVRNQKKTIRDISEVVMRQIIGDISVDEAVTIGRTETQNTAKQKLQEILDSYETGLQIVDLKLQSVHAPRRVRPSFNEVNEAKAEKEKRVNEAYTAYNEAIPKARGGAERNIKEAEAYAIERINQAKGNANKFNAIYEEYAKAKDVTRRRLYLEMAREVFPKLGNRWVIEQEGKEGRVFPLLILREEEKIEEKTAEEGEGK